MTGIYPFTEWWFALVFLIVFFLILAIKFGGFKRSKKYRYNQLPDIDKIQKSSDSIIDIVKTPTPRRGWNEEEKRRVRVRQDGKCARCHIPPPRWHYDHIDGDRSNNSMDNCQGLCPNCHDVKTHED